MARILLYLLLVCVLVIVHVFTRSSHDYVKCNNDTSPYDHLILTPYIEQGKIEEGRNASRVNPQLFLNIESYSGYVTVNSEYNSQMFFWYFPSLAKPVNDTPWIIWLQGGPGSSSMIGLFEEMGPFRINEFNELELHPHTWLASHSMVFIDNPVGTGFSCTEQLVRDMDMYGAQMHSAVKQLVQLYPELREAPLFVAGESYAGKYVPALAAQIHRHKNDTGCDGCRINLQGLILGNAFVEPEMISNVDQAFIRCKLLNKSQTEPLQEKISRLHQYIEAKNGSHRDAFRVQRAIMHDLKLKSNHDDVFNCKYDSKAVRQEVRNRTLNFLTKSEVERALHVIQCWDKNNSSKLFIYVVNGDFLSSARLLVEELLEKYRVLSYCGQLDLMVPCHESHQQYRKFHWSKSEEFQYAVEQVILYKNTALEITEGGGLTWAVVRDAGHKVPTDAPELALRLVTSWIQNALTPDAFN